MRGFHSQPENQKLIKMAAMLSSPNDGERLNAISLLDRELRNRGSNLNRVLTLGLASLDGPIVVPRRSSPVRFGQSWKSDALRTLSCPCLKLEPHEIDFLQQMRRQDRRPSEKQLNWIAALVGKASKARGVAA